MKRDRRAIYAAEVARSMRVRPACNKVSFPSKRVALGRLRTLTADGMTKAYKCPTCGLWHLTSQETRGPSTVRVWRALIEASNPTKDPS